METDTSIEETGSRGPGKASLILKVLIQVIVLLPILAALLFIPAGHIDWVMGWVLLGLYLASLIVTCYRT
jgi:hypothetical protein